MYYLISVTAIATVRRPVIFLGSFQGVISGGTIWLRQQGFSIAGSEFKPGVASERERDQTQ